MDDGKITRWDEPWAGAMGRFVEAADGTVYRSTEFSQYLREHEGAAAAPSSDDWTPTGFHYIQRQPCGCATGAIMEFTGRLREFTAECVKEAIMGGATVERVADVDLQFGPCRCLNIQ